MTDNVLALSHHLEIQRSADSRGVVLTLQGELDLGSAPRLEQELREIGQTPPDRIVIDLRPLEFMDCTGLALLVRAQQSAHTNGYLLALHRGPRQVQRLFQLTGRLDYFTFSD